MRADQNDLPVLFLTTRDAAADRLHGLTIGGDDYLTKPFGVDELVARVKVILRRAGRSSATQLIQCGDLSLDDDAHTVLRSDVELVLSPTEYKMLRYFMRNAGLVVSKAQILDHVWHYDFIGESTVVETHLSTLRKKLGSDGRDLIQTVRGYGYRLNCCLEPNDPSPAVRRGRCRRATGARRLGTHRSPGRHDIADRPGRSTADGGIATSASFS